MGSLSNLYISQSYQSLIHLGSDTGASGTPTQLQDGLGTNIGIYVNTNGEVSASSYSGSVNGIGNVSAFSASVNSRILAITSSTIDTASLVTTASFNAYTQSTNTFTSSISTSVGLLQTFSASQYKGDSSSFDSRILAITSSGGVPAGTVSSSAQITAFGFATTGSNTFTGVNNFSASVEMAGGLSLYDNGITIGYPKQMGDPFQNIGINTAFVYGQSSKELVLSGDAMTQKGVSINNGLTVTGSLYVAPKPGMTPTPSNITASGDISASGNIYGANLTASAIPNGTVSSSQQIIEFGFATTASVNTLSSSIFQTDSTQSNNINSLTALTASTAYTNVNNTFSGTQSFDNVVVTGTASVAFLNVTYQSSSVIYSSGSNILGDEANVDTQTLVGRVITTGSFEVTGSSRFNGNVSITGSANVNGSPIIVSSQTSSMAVSSSTYAVTASYSLNAQTASQTNNVVITARNGNQSTLGAGTVVRITSAVGDNPIFNTSSYNNEAQSSNTLGILRTSIASGADGEVVVNGIVLGVNTDPSNGYVAGDVIYLSSSGQFTRTQPQAPNQTVTLGEVLRAQQNNGSIYVNISNGWELNELHNVQINTPLTNDILAYESSSYGLWKNKSIGTLGLATTGSNTFIGNQSIEGNLYISSSNTSDVIVNGQIFVSSSATSGASAVPKITVSGSAGTTTINRNSITTRNADNQAVLNPLFIAANVLATNDEIGFSVDAAAGGVGGWTTGPAIYVNNDAGDTYPAVFGFQNKTNYTDGRVTVLTPLSASKGIVGDTSITGSLILSSSNVVELNVIGNSIITGSLILSSSNAVELQVIGGVEITGSVATPPVAVTITSNTASIDFSKGSIYTLTLVSGSNTYITASNITPGQTANLLVTQASALSGSIVWASSFKFPTGSAYTGSKVVNAVDLISFITVNNSTIYSVGASNLV